MPSSVIKKLSDKADISVSDLEALWDRAKEAAAKSNHKEDFAVIMAIFKKMVKGEYGATALRKVGWKVETLEDYEESPLEESEGTSLSRKVKNLAKGLDTEDIVESLQAAKNEKQETKVVTCRSCSYAFRKHEDQKICYECGVSL